MSDTEKNELIRASFEKARAARMAGNRKDALASWAVVIAETETPNNAEQRQARMAACSESALVYQELGDIRKAHALLSEAVKQAETVVAENATPETLLALAGVRTNFASLLVANRIAKEGREVGEKALEAVQQAGEVEGTVLLTFAAKMQIGSAQLLEGDAAGGAATLASAAEYGIRLVEAGQQAALPQLVETVARLAAGARVSGNLAQYQPLAERVARLSEAAFQAGGPPFLNIFVASQMHLATWLTETGRFAQAEDVLWKTIDGSGQGALLVSAPNFYAQIWRATDEALEKGDLPREEVKDAWIEAIEKAEKRGADVVAVKAMRARYTLHVDGKREDAEAIIRDQKTKQNEVSALAREVLMVLEQELSALATV